MRWTCFEELKACFVFADHAAVFDAAFHRAGEPNIDPPGTSCEKASAIETMWVCLKMLCSPLYPMVLLTIILIKWLYLGI